ncbi:MAG: hypothetical protein IT249_03880 [Chitinophagaceae bacterium]|nr:hypothetical protein [Chitinophagaceae bacterium]
MNLLFYLSCLSISIALIFVGINAIGNSRKTAEFFLKLTFPKWYKNWVQKMMNQEWFFVNLKIGGIAAIFVGIILIIAVYYSLKRMPCN